MAPAGLRVSGSLALGLVSVLNIALTLPRLTRAKEGGWVHNLPSLNHPRQNPAYTRLNDGTIFVSGGTYDQCCLDNVLSSASFTWSTEKWVTDSKTFDQNLSPTTGSLGVLSTGEIVAAVPTHYPHPPIGVVVVVFDPKPGGRRWVDGPVLLNDQSKTRGAPDPVSAACTSPPSCTACP
jgi:hypothetical protein